MNLFEFARDYSNFGYHRTGSQSQLATENWLFACLQTSAESVQPFYFDYQYFKAESELHLNGRLITSMPLYYEAVGNLKDCGNVETSFVKIGTDEPYAYASIQILSRQAEQNKCDALVVATRCVNDSLYAFNVQPALKNTLPVVLVPGHEYQNLFEQKINLRYSASIKQHTAKNIIARFGEESTQKTIVITTPISGWFECAGERGTGVALAISLAQHLSRQHRVDLVLTSGHELGYLGGFEYTTTLRQPPAAVIHLGSSLATFDSSLQAWSNIETTVLEKLLQNSSIPLNKVTMPGERSNWVGEAECWSHFSCPMLSIAGEHSAFHTPQDRIDLVTSETELSKMFEVISKLAGVIATTV